MRVRLFYVRVQTTGPNETEAAGAKLAGRLAPGDIVLVSGELGSGKTTFVRGACRALGSEEPVTSPTFTIGQLYRGRIGDRSIEIAHVDLYRLTSLGGEDQGLLDDYVTGERLVFIEWPGAAEPELERVAARIQIEHAGGDRRVLDVE